MPYPADQKAVPSRELPCPSGHLAVGAISARAQPHPAPPRPHRWRFRFGRLLVIAVVLAGLRTFVAETSIVPTGSMEGTILVGDHLFLNKLPYGPEIPLLNFRLPRWKTVRRGEIVVFHYPRDPGEIFLKRVIGIGGDRLEIHDGVVYRNSRRLDEPYVVHRRPGQSSNDQMAQVTVPPGSLFVMGDNRDNSSDSREWGFVPEQNVISEPLFVYWSYDAPTTRWLDPEFTHQVRFEASIAGNFFSRTRWIRMGMLL